MKHNLIFLSVWILILPLYLIFHVLFLEDITERITNYYLNGLGIFIVPLASLLIGFLLINKGKKRKFNFANLFIILVGLVVGFAVLLKLMSFFGT